MKQETDKEIEAYQYIKSRLKVVSDLEVELATEIKRNSDMGINKLSPLSGGRVAALACYMERSAASGRADITIRELRDSVKHRPAFKGSTSLTSDLKLEIIPIMVSMGLCKFDGKVITYL